jgi:hypothetical protein
MKNLFLAGLILVSSNVFASEFVNIKTLTNKTLESAKTELSTQDVISHWALKKVTKLKGKGASAQEIRQNAVAQALHTVCGFFDDGVSINLNSKDEKGSLRAVADLLDSSNLTESDTQYKTLVRVVSTINNQTGVELYSGSASGNNTAGTVLGLYDIKNNEIAVFASTNCGKDD